ncbi:MAG: class I SAM-dependent methyltransferase [Paludibacter sp.]|nr:class I SAM-dependent methyltransferase [Paludibacter sp.]
MKVRQSGMPDESMWNSYFDIKTVLSELQIDSRVNDLVEIGTGYGTFTLPAARIITGTVYGFDIEKDMLDIVKQKLANDSIENVVLEQRDILTRTTGLAANSMDYVMLFNILHHESPNDFLQEAFRILKQNGRIGIIHWRSDIETPRGPDLSIRPKPEQMVELIDKQKFRIEKGPFHLEPFHYGLLISKL